MKLAFDPQMHIPRSAFENGDKADQGKRQAMKDVCQSFEAFFLQSMFKEMRDTVPQGGLLEESFSSGFYREMLDKQVAQQSAQRDDFGLAQAMYEQFSASRTDGIASEKEDPKSSSENS